MADLGTITWKVKVDTTDLKAADGEMDKARKSADDFEKSAKRAGTTATTTGRKTKTATGEMSRGFNTAKRAVIGFAAVLGTVGIARSLSNAVAATNAFNASVSELSAITGAVGEDLEFFAEQSKDIGRTTSLSASQAVTAFKLIASAKPDLLESASALNAVTREAVTLAEAAGIELTQAANTVGISLNQFAAGAEEANRFVNVLAAGSKFGASAIAETSLALKNSGAAANAAGLSFEETNAAIQALAAGGIKAGEAGTGLRNVILILEQELDDNLKPSVVGISTAMANLAAQELSITEMTDIFGRQNVVAAQTLVDNAAAVGTLEIALTGTAVATEQARINMDNLSGDILEGKSATEGLQIAFGERLTPRLREARQGLTEFTNSITGFVESEEFLEWVGLATVAAQALAVVLAVNIVAAAGSAAIAFAATAVQAGILTTAMTLMSGPTAIGLLIATLGGLFIAWQNIKNIQDDVIDSSSAYIRKTMGAEGLDLAILGVMNDLRRLNSEFENQVTVIDESTLSGHRLRNEQNKLAKIESARVELVVRINSLAEERIRIQEIEIDTTGDAETVTQQLTEAEIALAAEVARLTALLDENEEGLTAVDDATTELIASIQQEIDDLERSERELAILNATRGLAAEATDEQRATVERLTGALFDEEEQIKATKSEEEEARAARLQGLKATETENERVAKQVAKDWRDTRDFFADTFVDLVNNGSSAFGALLDSFKDMVTRMVAQWVASGIMNLLGLGGGGGGGLLDTVLGGGGGGGGGSIVGNVASNAVTNAITGSSIVSGAGGAGGAGAGILSTAAGVGGQILGGLTGTAVGTGSAIVGPPTAAATFGANVGAFLTNPVTLAIIGTAIIASLLDDSGTFSHNAGFLTQDLAAVDADRKFDIDPFASGAQFTGFNRRTSQADATAVVDIFRAYDAALTEAALAVGITPNLNAGDFIGFDEKGQGVGAFFGSASEDGGGEGIPVGQQLDQFGARWIDLVGRQNGVAASVIADIIGGGTSAGILSRAQGVAGIDGSFQSGLDRVPFDGFIAELHQGERITPRRQADADDAAAATGRGNFFSMIFGMARNLSKISTAIDQWFGQGFVPTRDNPAP